MERFEEHIISSPTKICGVYQSPDFSVLPMFDTHHSDKYFYVIKIKNEGNLDQEFNNLTSGVKAIRRNYMENIKNRCTIFSVFFGKRIEYCGLLKSGGTYYIPPFSYKTINYKGLPFNDDNERIDRYVSMNWAFIEEILNLIKDKNLDMFLEAGSFYTKSLINIDYDIEIAYVDLVRCIEVLSNSNIKAEEIEFSGDLAKIYNKIKNSPTLAKTFRLHHGVGKKFRDTILDLTKDSNIWDQTESKRPLFSLKSLDTLEKKTESIKNAYDIRSKYVHQGLYFGTYIIPYCSWLRDKEGERFDGLNELINSEPGKKNKTNDCIKITKTLTFLGLERIVRTCLIEYLKRQ